MKTSVRTFSRAVLCGVLLSELWGAGYCAVAQSSTPAIPASPAPDASHARYVFLFIGDGMGANQRLLAEIVSNGATSPAPADYRQLLMNQFPVTGLVNTRSASSWITDSAAAGTAIACGRKTANHVIAMDPARVESVSSLADTARDRGMKVGLATTVELDDATPSVFCAHAPDRSLHPRIARQMFSSPVEFLAGNTFADSHKVAEDAAMGSGRRIVRTVGDMAALTPAAGRVWVLPRDTEKDGSQPYSLDQSESVPEFSLAAITEAGIRCLENPKGFFFMVEGGKIDWACHANDAASEVGDVLALDRAIAVAVGFYRRHPAETLILVTADHETGGLALGRNDTGYALHPEFIAGQKCGAVRLGAKIRTWRKAGKTCDEVLSLLKSEWLDYETLSAKEKESLSKAYGTVSRSDGEGKEGVSDPLVAACLEFAAKRAGIAWTSHAHSSSAVPVTVLGAGQNRFTGWMDNTEMSRRIGSLLIP